jgi:hypothetical protein
VNVGSGGVGSKCQVTWSPPALSPAGAGGPAAGWLDSTVQRAGTVTWKVNSAFRSGWSKHAYAVRAYAWVSLP